jgi:hypothetical protein
MAKGSKPGQAPKGTLHPTPTVKGGSGGKIGSAFQGKK